MCSWGWGWAPYVSVAEKKRQAASRLAKLKKKGRPVAPVVINGRKIATSFWGISWCQNLERYSDYASRLPRGRSYVYHGAVIDLQIGKGQVSATISGTELYTVKITVAPVARARWQAICKDCAGTIDSLVELLQGRIAKSVMDRVCRQADGLFPAPSEIELSCDCPDWADMCKHVAAALYGVGARLDEKPELLFLLRGVDEGELIAGADKTLAQPGTRPDTPNILAAGDVAALFGLDMADSTVSAAPRKPATVPKLPRREKVAQTKPAATRGASGPKSPPRKKAAKMATAPVAATGGTSAAKPVRKSSAAKTSSAPAPVKVQARTAGEKLRRIPAKKTEAKRQSDAKSPDKTPVRGKSQSSRAPRSK